MKLPNFVYIGPDKAGSTWLFNLLSHHRDVYVTPAKDLYFFDRYFNKGLEWYSRQFAGSDQHRVTAEISHDYLYSSAAPRRMARVLPPGVRLMVCLREPVGRAFSNYLYLLRCGQFRGTFEAALERFPGLIDRGLYGKHLSKVLDYFPRDQIISAEFDQLQEDPQGFADRVLTGIGVHPIKLPEALTTKALPAAKSRFPQLTRGLRFLAGQIRDAGMPKLVGQIKTSRLVQSALYRGFTAADRPQVNITTRRKLHDLFAADIQRLDSLLGTQVGRQWGYEATYTEHQLLAR